MKVYLQPQPKEWPSRGGVAEHLRQLYTQLATQIEWVDSPEKADILHVESAWPIPRVKKPVVYVCHGGFRPTPISVVIDNLNRCDIIVSVAGWMIDQFFPLLSHKTTVIPNGVNLGEFNNLEDNELEPGFVLYAKEWPYYQEDFINLVEERPDLKFVTTIWPDPEVPFNVKRIGLQSKDRMQSILSKAGCLLLTGSEVCPTMLLEAWALKVPVVAKNIDGSKELMETESGDLIGGELYTDEDLGDCIDFVLSHREELGQEGRKEVEMMYQWKDLVEEYLNVYRSLI